MPLRNAAQAPRDTLREGANVTENERSDQHDPQRTPSAEPAEALAALVAKLREELSGVRTAMRNRAVIEQAKGVLVERLGITPDQGFDHLVRLSQRTNVKLIEVAATIVGTTAPDPTPGTPTDQEYRAHLARTRGRRPQPEVKGAAAPPQQQPPAARAAVPPQRQPAARPGGRASRPPALTALQAQHQLISARVSAAASYDEIAEAICTTSTAWPDPAFVVLTALEPDGAQRIIGSHRFPPEIRSQWARIPPDPGLAAVAAIRDRAPVWLPDQATAYRLFPSLRQRPFPAGSVLAAPLTVGERLLGCLIMTWETSIAATDDVRRYLFALAEPVARRLDDLLGDEVAGAWQRLLATGTPGAGPPGEKAAGHRAAGGQADQPVLGLPAGEWPTAVQAVQVAQAIQATGMQAQVWLPSVLDTLLDPAVLMAPVRDDGPIVDFRIEYANAPARSLLASARVDTDHATLLALYPATGSAVLLPELTRLVHGGDPVRLTDLPVAGVAGGTDRPQLMTVHAARLWDRVLMAFRSRGDAELLHPQLVQAERVAQIGSFSYDPRLGEVLCSPQLYRMYHGGDRDDPVSFTRIVECVHPDDAPAVRDAVRRTFQAGRRLVTEFRGAGPMAGHRLRITAEPRSAPDGTTIGVLGTVRDVTAERAHEARLRVAEEALAAQRRRLESEHRAAVAVRQALLPTHPDLTGVEGISVAGRARTTAGCDQPGGDWYDVMALADGASVLLLSAAGDGAEAGPAPRADAGDQGGVGDRNARTGRVEEAGIASMVAAATLRSTVRSYAPLGAAPADILTAVNGTLCASATGHPATLVVAVYDPADRRLRWASAGSVVALRYPAGRPRGQMLAGPSGPPIGAAKGVRYRDASIELTPGDQVLICAGPPASEAIAVAVRTPHWTHLADPAYLADLDALVRHVRRTAGARAAEEMCLLLMRVDADGGGGDAEAGVGGTNEDGSGAGGRGGAGGAAGVGGSGVVGGGGNGRQVRRRR